MRIQSLIAAIFLSVLLIGGTTRDPPEERIVHYRCGDLVVIGRIKNLSYDPIDEGIDILGHGLIKMRITIRKVLAGGERRRVVHATIIAHAYRREDLDFLMVLTPSGKTEYRLLEAAGPNPNEKPRLATSCDATRRGD